MASMMGGDLVEAYVLKNAYKEKMRRMDEAAVALEGKNNKDQGAGAGSAGEKKAAASTKGGFFGLMKKKVHPKTAAAAAAKEISGASS